VIRMTLSGRAWVRFSVSMMERAVGWFSILVGWFCFNCDRC
jgi:hypothetical protein